MIPQFDHEPSPVPFFVPDVTKSDRDAVDAVLRSGWLTTGPAVSAFERAFADQVGAEHAVAVNSCTAALQIALATWGIGPGDEVLLPTLTFASAAEVVVHSGAKPVLVDVRADDLTIDVAHAEHLISERTRVVMPMHYGGQPYDVPGVQHLAEKHNLLVLDDAAHTPPAFSGPTPVGALADITCFSFYANKPITTGEGGMLVTDNRDWADVARSLSLHGLSQDAWSRFKKGGSWNYDVVRLGYKSNMSDVAAAMGLSQLKRIDQSHAHRRQVAEFYAKAFAALPGITPLARQSNRTSSWHLYVVRLASSHYDRDGASRLLADRGIGTSVHYKPLHMHSYFRETLAGSGHDFPNANDAYREILSLPIHSTLADEDALRVVHELAELAKE